MIKAIIFDFDGVIVDTYENHYKTYAKKYKNLDRETHRKLFEGNIHHIRGLEIKDSKIDVLELLREDLIIRKIEKGVLKELLKLKKKYNLFIISSNKESTLSEFFMKQDISNLFKDILGVETNVSKEIKFRLLMRKYSLKTSEIVFVTDTLGDILEARKLKIKTIAVDFGFHERKRLEKGRPYKIVSRFNDIQRVVSKM
jgi:phosphoglycolate phosphatase